MPSLSIGGLPVHGMGSLADDKLKVLLYGAPGSGKSWLASSVAELGPTLYVDMIGEKGPKSFQGAPWAENVHIVRPTTIQQIDDLWTALNRGDHPYKAAVIDSISAVQKTAIRFLLGYEETALREINKGNLRGPELQTWGHVLTLMTDILTFWYSLADGERGEQAMHVIMTSQMRSRDGEDQGAGDRLQPDLSKGVRGVALAVPSYVLYTDREEFLTEEGDMTSRHIAHLGYTAQAVTKGRIPAHLHGKIPDVLGRGASSLTLKRFASALQIPL